MYVLVFISGILLYVLVLKVDLLLQETVSVIPVHALTEVHAMIMETHSDVRVPLVGVAVPVTQVR